MRNLLKTVSLVLLVSTGLNAASQTRKAVFIIADGIPADVIEKLNTPNLKRIAKQGTYLRAHVGGEKGGYSQTPTISANGYNSLLTATWVNKHNVWGNDIKAPNYNYWNVFRMFKNAYPNKKTAVFSSWTDNRTKLIGDKLPEAGNIHPDYAYDGYELDTVKFPHDKAGNYMHLIDEQVAASAANCIKDKAPDLSWVYLEYTDDMGHKYGDSPQYYDAIEKMDAQVGKIWAAIQYRKQHFKEDWLIFITTDHGRSEATGKDHGGQSTRQRSTWMVTSYRPLNSYAKYYTPGIVDITPSINSFLNVKVPEAQLREMDGISLIGPLSVAEPTANYVQGALDITWKALDPKGNVKIWIAADNTFKEGKADDYKLLATVPVTNEHVLVDVKNTPSKFYKIAIEGLNNTVNRWVVLEEKK
jgi:predicted AlkP superfamily pyrophosphatase or phosphodiesterase